MAVREVIGRPVYFSVTVNGFVDLRGRMELVGGPIDKREMLL